MNVKCTYDREKGYDWNNSNQIGHLTSTWPRAWSNPCLLLVVTEKKKKKTTQGSEDYENNL